MATYLRMLLRVPMQSDNFFNMVRLLVRSRARLLFKNRRLVSRNSSSRTTKLRTAFKAVAEPTRCRIKGYRDGALRICEVAYIHSTRFRAVRRLWALFVPRSDSGNVRCRGKADKGGAMFGFRP